MRSADWSRVRELFERSLDLPVEERAAFAEREAAGDAELLRAVERLMERETQEDDFLVSPAASALLPAVAPGPVAPALAPGDRLGAYVVERVIGSGGMGTVYAARQERPSRTVALKVVRFGLRSPQALERFRLEGEVLGRLRHPGIATIHEMGVQRLPVPGGGEVDVPFLAMELVEGARDLLTHAEEEGLDTAARLELLGEVCAAVHHGHQKGVIHRDLKPGNVLVDASGRPRVIDYGVARVAEGPFGVETQAGHVVGTLQYLAPEQLRGEVADAVSDVWALGVMLYELLTGEPPCDLRSRSFTEAIETICERPSPRPSARADGIPTDLDWIALKALEKEPARRYGSAADLAADLVRFRDHEPVTAGPPTKRYRAAKFVRRHRVAVGAAVLLLVTLVAGVVGTTRGLMEAEAERERAVAAGLEEKRARERAEAAEADANRAREAERREREAAEHEAQRARAALGFVEGAFVGMTPQRGGRRELRVVDFLDMASAELDAREHVDPSVELTLRELIGVAYTNLGRYQEAEPHLQRVRVLAVQLHGPDSAEALEAGISEVALGLRRGAPADDELVADLLVRTGAVLGEDHPFFVGALHNAALQAFWQGRHTEARPLFEQSVERSRRVLGPDAPLTVTRETDYASCLIELGELEEATVLLREALELSRTTLPPDHPDLLTSVGNLGSLYLQLGELDRAEELLREAYGAFVGVFGPRSESTLRVAINLALVLKKRGAYGEAEVLYREAASIAEELLGPDSLDLLVVRGNLGTLLHARGHHAESARVLEGVLEDRLRVLPPQNPGTVTTMNNLAGVYEDSGRLEEAEALYRRALELELAARGAENLRAPLFHSNLGGVLAELGRGDEAAEHFAAARRVLEDLVSPDHPAFLRLERLRAELEQDLGRWQSSLEIVEALFPVCERVHGPASMEALTSGHLLAEALHAVGRESEGRSLAEALFTRARGALGDEHPMTRFLAAGRGGE